MFDTKQKLLIHVIRIDLESDEVIYKYSSYHAPRKGDEIRINENTFYEVDRVVWCVDEPDSPFTRVNIGVKIPTDYV